MIEPWQRRQDETALQYEWFTVYLKMVPSMRVDLARAVNVVSNHYRAAVDDYLAAAETFSWADRAAAYDEGWVDRDVVKQIRGRVNAARAALILHGFDIAEESLSRIHAEMQGNDLARQTVGDVVALVKLVDAMASRAMGGIGGTDTEAVDAGALAAMSDAEFESYRKRVLGL